MRRSLAWYSAPGSFVHVPSWADFITITSGFSFRYTQVQRAVGAMELSSPDCALAASVRAVRNAREGCAQAVALRALLQPSVAGMTSLAQEAGAADLIRHQGHVYVYRSEEGYRKDQAGWSLRRDNGVKLR